MLTQGVGTSQGEGTSGTDMDMYGVCCVCCVTVCGVRVGVCGDARPFRLLRNVLMFWLVLFLCLLLSIRDTYRGTCWDRMSHNQHGAQNELSLELKRPRKWRTNRT